MRKIFAALAVCVLLGADKPEDAVKKDLEQLQGEWAMVSGERDGQALPEDVVKDGKRVSKDGETTVTIGDQVVLKAKYAIDPSKKPKAIDYTLTDGAAKDQKVPGIYELDGDTVKFCFSAPGKDRPTEFTAKEGSGRTMTVWKRAKK